MIAKNLSIVKNAIKCNAKFEKKFNFIIIFNMSLTCSQKKHLCNQKVTKYYCKIKEYIESLSAINVINVSKYLFLYEKILIFPSFLDLFETIQKNMVIMRKIRVIIIVIIRKGIALNFLLIAPQVSIEACDKKPVRPLRCRKLILSPEIFNF